MSSLCSPGRRSAGSSHLRFFVTMLAACQLLWPSGLGMGPLPATGLELELLPATGCVQLCRDRPTTEAHLDDARLWEAPTKGKVQGQGTR